MADLSSSLSVTSVATGTKSISSYLYSSNSDLTNTPGSMNDVTGSVEVGVPEVVAAAEVVDPEVVVGAEVVDPEVVAGTGVVDAEVVACWELVAAWVVWLFDIFCRLWNYICDRMSFRWV